MSATFTGVSFELSVNGTTHRFAESEAAGLLVHFLRESLGHTDVKLACGEGACSACCVLIDGESIPSCLVMLGRLHGHTVRTPADLAGDPVGELIATELAGHGGLQCGFCTPGIVCSIYGLALSRGTTPISPATGVRSGAEQEDVLSALGGHICRCTGYRGILSGARAALDALAEREPAYRGEAD